MHVNVYTYYQNKLALEAAQKRARRRARSAEVRTAAARSEATSWLDSWALRGLLLGLILAESLWWLGWAHPIPLGVSSVLLASWGFVLGSFADWSFLRMRKVAAALRGDRLTRHDVSVLSGRPVRRGR